MDRETIRSMFFPNNSNDMSNLDNSVHTQQSDAARALEIAGYPTLLQEYLLQQQQKDEQQRRTSMNTATAFGSNPLGLTSSGGLLRNNSLALTGGALSYGAPTMLSQLDVLQQQHQQHQLADANQLLLERLRSLGGLPQGIPAGLPAGVWGTPSGLKTNDLANQFAEKGILGPWSEHSAGLLGSMVEVAPAGSTAKVKKGRKKQPKDKDRPKRPLSAYNLFFKEERARMLQKLDEQKKEKGSSSGTTSPTPSKIGFENLAKMIGSKWQQLTPSQVEIYKEKAMVDMKRYKSEMEIYLAKRQQSGKEPQEVVVAVKDEEEPMQESASV